MDRKLQAAAFSCFFCIKINSVEVKIEIDIVLYEYKIQGIR